MSEHEHQMVPDHAIPPYAWHYKCSVEGCDYETDSFQILKDGKDAEIARLRAQLTKAEAVVRAAEWCKEVMEGKRSDEFTDDLHAIDAMAERLINALAAYRERT